MGSTVLTGIQLRPYKKCTKSHKMQNAGMLNQGFTTVYGEKDNHEPPNYTVFSTVLPHLIVSIF